VAAGGEMTQALYAHMNNKKNFFLKFYFVKTTVSLKPPVYLAELNPNLCVDISMLGDPAKTLEEV
jgi:hypothetical protein